MWCQCHYRHLPKTYEESRRKERKGTFIFDGLKGSKMLSFLLFFPAKRKTNFFLSSFFLPPCLSTCLGGAGRHFCCSSVPPKKWDLNPWLVPDLLVPAVDIIIFVARFVSLSLLPLLGWLSNAGSHSHLPPLCLAQQSGKKKNRHSRQPPSDCRGGGPFLAHGTRKHSGEEKKDLSKDASHAI